MNKSKWKKIKPHYFSYDYKGNNFLICTYPFKIFHVLPTVSQSDLNQFIKNSKKNIPHIVSPGKYYLPLLISTTTCNFNCSYCFAHQGTYGQEAQMMDKAVIESTLKFLEKKMLKLRRNVDKKNIEVGIIFFGGEPLLNFLNLKHLVKQLCRTIDKLNHNSILTFKPLVIINTNGTLFSSDILRYLKENRDIFEIVVSFDGLEHDKNRFFKDGRPTSEDVIKGIKTITSSGIRYSITCCVTPFGINTIKENINYITKLCGKDIEINLSFIRGAIKTVWSKTVYPGQLQSLYTVESLLKFGRDISELIRKGYHIYERKFYSRINEGGSLWRCPACLFEFCVNVNGDVYPCHNFIDNKFKLGHIFDENFDPLNNKKVSEIFNQRTIDNLECKDCVFQTLCLSSFDCPSHSYYDLGDINKIDKRTCLAAQNIMEALFETKLLDPYIEANKL